MRKFFIFGGLFLLLLSAFFVWRKTHPPLTDEQQIAAALDGITQAANEKNPRGIASFLAHDFKFGSTGKKEFQNSLVGGMLQYRVVDLQLAGATVHANGETATSEGRYALSLKSEYNSPPEIYRGKFNLQWRKDDGNWLVTGAQGDQLPNFN